jgi:peptidoglycan/xylan/chitin deacetylase (PgdA/CDA1 family)
MWPAHQRALEDQKPLRFARFRQRDLPPGVYILTYHSIFDDTNAVEWEGSYSRIATNRRDFAAHLEWLCEHLTPLATSDLLTLPTADFQAKAWFVIHFDDGYQTLLKNALPIVNAYPIRPAVFVNGDFAAQRSIYYRVYAAVMTARQQGQLLREALTENGFSPPASDAVFDFLKNAYRYPDTEQAVAMAWQRANPGEALSGVHLTWDELKTLAESGWEIGNHTASHANLAGLSLDDHHAQIAGNEGQIREAGLNPLPVLAFPNGWASHVDATTESWLNQQAHYHGMFGAGGVNLRPSRTEWFRISVGDWTLPTLIRQIKREASRKLS